MRAALLLSLIFFSNFIFADVLRVDHIQEATDTRSKNHVYLSDGRIGFLENSKSIEWLTAEEAYRKDVPVDILLDKDHNILKIKISKDIDRSESFHNYYLPADNDYKPTVLPNLAEVNSVFRRMNRRWQRDSQCYNRAHVWNYEEFEKTGLLSKKVFIFYTRRYIRNYNFKWWFHAIPTVLAQHEGSIVERYLDPMFAKAPLPQKSWTDIFIKSRRSCPVISKYSQYWNNQETEDCYLHFSSMYYWQPRDLDKFERTGIEKKFFIRSEVNHAYWEAF